MMLTLERYCSVFEGPQAPRRRRATSHKVRLPIEVAHPPRRMARPLDMSLEAHPATRGHAQTSSAHTSPRRVGHMAVARRHTSRMIREGRRWAARPVDMAAQDTPVALRLSHQSEPPRMIRPCPQAVRRMTGMTRALVVMRRAVAHRPRGSP
mgnify:CR=1 FL=1